GDPHRTAARHRRQPQTAERAFDDEFVDAARRGKIPRGTAERAVRRAKRQGGRVFTGLNRNGVRRSSANQFERSEPVVEQIEYVPGEIIEVAAAADARSHAPL